MHKLGRVEKNDSAIGGWTKNVIWVIVIVAFVALLFFKAKGSLNLSSLMQSSQKQDGSIPAEEVPQYEAFAKKVAISICNIGFHNTQTYLADNSKYFSQDQVYQFQNSFFTLDLQRQISDQQLYCTAEDVVSAETKVHNNLVSDWFTGDMEYTSHLTNSSIRIPFSFRLIIQKFPEGFKVVGFYLVTDQK
jgi:hypothetical protein